MWEPITIYLHVCMKLLVPERPRCFKKFSPKISSGIDKGWHPARSKDGISDILEEVRALETQGGAESEDV